ncbi:MAG: hypothetical protein AVDCRST_MAG49-3578 [uncultured Thermomicrobiales bacterium]|uniref:Uncharacterized protein n=1 Tax=uncultured Thermomicrobiales bacterium TaxID=1645740 RepID=A0A6J4V7A6_9BACT|nr:MAG: hypothetical protein AVDCRST_MAG49-3578 [uncultured Thermomicrobiales bacterium]
MTCGGAGDLGTAVDARNVPVRADGLEAGPNLAAIGVDGIRPVRGSPGRATREAG